MRHLILVLLMLFTVIPGVMGQIDFVWMDTTSHGDHDMGYFFYKQASEKGR